jgi:lactoylglutathione lyase
MNAESVVSDLSFRIHHTMLPVANLDRSIEFYTQFLGMREMGRRSDQNRKVEVAHVGYGERDTNPSVELTMDVSETAPAEVRRTGIHVAIQVSDLHRLCDALENNHVTFLQPLKDFGGRRLTAWIRDPDAHVIELIEICSV